MGMIPAAQAKQIADQQHKITFADFEQELVVFLDELVYEAAKRGTYNAMVALDYHHANLIFERLKARLKIDIFDSKIKKLTTAQLLDMVKTMCHDAGYKTENPCPGYLLISWDNLDKRI